MLKKLKSLFVVEDNTQKKPAAKADQNPLEAALEMKEAIAPKTQKKSPSPQPSAPESQTNPASTSSSSAKPDEKFVNRLLGAIEQNNQEGFDYLEYKQALQSLTDVSMDESTRYKSAMAMAKTMGASENSIIDAAQHYLNILKSEEEKFQVAFKSQSDKRVNDRTQKMKELEDSITAKKQQIKNLEQELVQLDESLDKIKSDANQANAKVMSTKEGFYAAYHSVVNQIKMDVEAMQKYLQ